MKWTFANLHSFSTYTNAYIYLPMGAMIRGPDGAIYGAQFGGDPPTAGNVFTLLPR